MSGPHESEDDSDPSNVLSRAREYHYRKLNKWEAEAVRRISTTLARARIEHDHIFFVLGSFEEGSRGKLKELQTLIDEWEGTDCKAFLMDDLGGDVEGDIYGLMKFRVIADEIDHVIGVCEHDRGGFLIEQGIISTVDRYTDRSHLLKRKYGEEQEREQYSWMQSSGVFRVFAFKERLLEWRNDSEFLAVSRALLRKLTE